MQRLQPVPSDEWPSSQYDPARIEVWKNDKFLAQVFSEQHGQLRVSVNSIRRKNGGWRDGITWEQLMEIKRQIGRAEEYAVEVLPRDTDIVNVANMRHFWILPSPVCGWKNGASHA